MRRYEIHSTLGRSLVLHRKRRSYCIDAARDARPKSEAEADEMRKAEQEGKSHAKGKDPALNKKQDVQQSPRQDPSQKQQQ